MNRGEFQKVEQLFPRCLTLTGNVELCRLYVAYVRRVNDVITGGEKARGTVIQAFEFAVNKVGIDVHSSELWNDYLDFLKSWTPAASWEQQQKVDLIRKVYKRCLVIPTEKIETMWSGYTKWENEVNSATASKFIAEKSTEFMDARSWNTEWHNITKRLLKRDIVPFTINGKRGGFVKSQLQLWFNWIELEKMNSLNLKDESQVHSRLEYVYKQAIATLPFVPEIWFRYNKFSLANNEEANLSKCIELTEEGLLLNPRSFLLTFQLSELYEKDNSFNRATETINKLINHLITEEKSVSQELEELKKSKIESMQLEAEKKTNDSDEDKNSDDSDDEMSVEPSIPATRLSDEDSKKFLALEEKEQELSKLITTVYIKLMMLCKRSALGIKEARTVFKQARDSFKNLGFELYTENALMEYYSDKQKTADKVFKLGMKLFSKNGEFLLSYLNYLIITNAVENIKVFFESAVSSLLKDITNDKEELAKQHIDLYQKQTRTKKLQLNEFYMRKIFKSYIKFATSYLEIDTVKSLEKRYEQFFPDDDPLQLFADRYMSYNLDTIKVYDLGKSQEEEPELEPSRKTKRQKTTPLPENYTPEATNVKNSFIPNQHGFVGDAIYSLLQVLPNAGYFGPPSEHVFNSSKLVELFSNLPDLPED